MILRGILERSLGGFICIRGYAKLSELATLSKSVSRRADSRQQSAAHTQDRKQSKKNLTRKHPSEG